MSKNKDNSPNNDKLDGQQGGSNPFSLPEDYFNSFKSRMLLKIELAEELKEFKLLSSLDKKSPFIIPDNYFVEASINTEIKTELTPYEKLAVLKKSNSFITPELYFEKAALRTAAKIEIAEELKEFSILSSLDRQNVFNVPEGYFETFSETVREKIFVEKNKAVNFGTVLRIVFNKKTAYALAAMLVLSLGLYFYNAKEVIANGDCNTLACLDRKEILKDNSLMPLDEESLMEMVNPETLSKNLKNSLEVTTEKDAEASSADKKEKEDFVLENIDVNDIVDEI